MIKATFYSDGKSLSGFEIKGHSGYADEGSDIICASVSSASYMAANTITEIIGEKADIEVSDGYLRLITRSDKNEVQTMLRGLQLHVNALAEDYKKYISCTEKLFKE